ncbi:MAG: lipoate--protein ligase family protein [Chloroflexi bacterium]|nr:lipoate--protein ligase family protein [Chloroflexota bacterium]
MQRPNWRLLKTAPAHGSWNMAVDEAILEAVGNGDVSPTLRFYAWEPPCLTLGYAQPISDVDHSKLENNGWEVVRRITGGRAILHTDELTYAVIVPANEPRLAGDIITSYKRLSQTLLAGLAQLGIFAQVEPNPKSAQKTSPNGPICFETPSNYEILYAGKKLIGSAQARRQSGILQHGSLPLFGNLKRVTDVLTFDNNAERHLAAQRLSARATTVEIALGKQVTWEEAASTFADAFSQNLEINLVPGDLSRDELTRTEQLIKDKYINAAWIERI